MSDDVTTTRDGNRVRYGKINRELVAGWLRLDPVNDGAFWALNLMKYRAVASYEAHDQPAISGREADDAYAPRESLAAVGAEIVFVADVDRVLEGDGTAWDRVAIVRYPSRRKFFEMQQRDDFKSKHVHKDAGMEFTIVMSCIPALPFGGSGEHQPFVELTVAEQESFQDRGAGTFRVEGVIVGDERVFGSVRFRWLDAPAAVDDDAATTSTSYRMLLRPTIDRLTRSVLDEPA